MEDYTVENLLTTHADEIQTLRAALDSIKSALPQLRAYCSMVEQMVDAQNNWLPYYAQNVDAAKLAKIKDVYLKSKALLNAAKS